MSEVTQRSGRWPRIRRFLGRALAAAAATAIVGHVWWTLSGSGEWRPVQRQDGIDIAALKVPGEAALKYKVRMHVDARLTDVVAFLTETESGHDLGAYDIRRLEQVAAPPVFYAYDTYKVRLPAPFGELEVVIINQYHQDPVTKVVRVNIAAAPNKLPPHPDLRRVVHLSNAWTLTPLAGGGVDVESVSEMDLGMPYWLANAAMPAVIQQEFAKIRGLLKLEKYRNKSAAFVTELHEQPRVDARHAAIAPVHGRAE
jgi:hypothetical protein